MRTLVASHPRDFEVSSLRLEFRYLFYFYKNDTNLVIIYKQYWDRWQSQTVDIRVCPILRTYRLFKTEIKLEPYLLEIKNSVTRRFLSRFRLSSHNLYIETGRWQRPKIPPEDRICPSCINGVEDEIHVFVQCQRYNDLRVPFFT